MFRGQMRLMWSLLAGIAHLYVIGLALWISFLLRFDFTIPSNELPLFYNGLLIALATKILLFYRDASAPGTLVAIPRVRGYGSAVRGQFRRLCSVHDRGLCVHGPRVLAFGLLPRPADLFRAHRRGPVRGAIAVRGARGLVQPAEPGRECWCTERARPVSRWPGKFGRIPSSATRSPVSSTTIRESRAPKLMGLPVLGTGKDAARIVATFRTRQPAIDEIVVTMPSATGRQIRAAFDLGCATGVRCRIVPGSGRID